MAELDTQVAELQSQIDAIEAELATLQNQIAVLENQLAQLQAAPPPDDGDPPATDPPADGSPPDPASTLPAPYASKTLLTVQTAGARRHGTPTRTAATSESTSTRRCERSRSGVGDGPLDVTRVAGCIEAGIGSGRGGAAVMVGAGTAASPARGT